MTDYHVTCIIPDSRDPGRRIDAVGGAFGVIDEDTAITMIRQGHTFYTQGGLMNLRAPVRIAGSILGGEYLTTSPDGYLPNNLLHMAHCRR
jgi:hypothetical protein